MPPTLNPLNAELNPICYLLALLGAHHFLHVSRIRVNMAITTTSVKFLNIAYNFIAVKTVPIKQMKTLPLI
jgi:hypothetical protein